MTTSTKRVAKSRDKRRDAGLTRRDYWDDEEGHKKHKQLERKALKRAGLIEER